jgi:hypothetical protein
MARPARPVCLRAGAGLARRHHRRRNRGAGQRPITDDRTAAPDRSRETAISACGTVCPPCPAFAPASAPRPDLKGLLLGHRCPPGRTFRLGRPGRLATSVRVA